MTNREYIMEQIKKTKNSKYKNKNKLYTEGETKSIKEALENWDQADNEYKYVESSRFLLRTTRLHLKESYKKRNSLK